MSYCVILAFRGRSILDLASRKQEIIYDQYGIRQKRLLKIALKKGVGRIPKKTEYDKNLQPDYNTYHSFSWALWFSLSIWTVSVTVYYKMLLQTIQKDQDFSG